MRKGWGLAVAVAAAAVVIAPAGAAAAKPVQQGNAFQTIGELEATGYDVVVDRVGSAPLSECFVTSVRNPQEITRTIAVGKGKDREFITVVVRRTITVSLNCDV